MTPDEYQSAQAALTQVDTELAAFDQEVRDAIAQARACNTRRAEIQNKRTALDAQVKPLREAVAAHLLEAKRVHTEQAKAFAEARYKAEAEAKAKEVSEADQLRAENAALKAQLEGK